MEKNKNLIRLILLMLVATMSMVLYASSRTTAKKSCCDTECESKEAPCQEKTQNEFSQWESFSKHLLSVAQ